MITKMWPKKIKANGRFIAKVNARSFMQIDFKPNNYDNISTPVTKKLLFVFCLFTVILRWANELIDVKGAYL